MDQTENNQASPVMGGTEWVMLLSLATLWGGSFFFFKVLVRTLPPLTLVLGRVGFSAVILNVWLAIRHDYMPKSVRAWGRFMMMGILNNVIPFTLIAFGETRISSGLAAILNATTPMFTVLAAHWLTANEKLNFGKAVGLTFGFVGVALIVGPDAFVGLRNEDIIGQAACLFAAISYAFAGIYGRRFKGMKPIKVATGQITGSTIVLLPLVAIVDHPWTLPMPNTETWGAMVGIVVLCTVVAYILYFRILATGVAPIGWTGSGPT
jgi:drug/metabolite transporter (DMT)-like permease